jgi:DNA-binding response OmpR family regulator
MRATDQRGHGTILLVEDEALLRELGETILRHAGYTVLSAHTRQEVNSLLQSYSNEIDLVLADVVMPEISGQEVVRLVRTRWPRVGVIYMSGYSDDEISGLEVGSAFLQKPFTPAELTDKVREMIGS